MPSLTEIAKCYHTKIITTMPIVKLPEVTLVKELIKNNVLVVTTGCSAQALGRAGLLDPEATLKFSGEGLKAVLTAVGQAVGLDGPLPLVLYMGSCVETSLLFQLIDL